MTYMNKTWTFLARSAKGKYMEVQWEYMDSTLIPTLGAGIHFMAQLAIWNTEMLQRF